MACWDLFAPAPEERRGRQRRRPSRNSVFEPGPAGLVPSSPRNGPAVAAMAGCIDRERIVMEWKPQRSGWIEERNFDIEFAETPEGYHVRVRVLGFPPLEDTRT